MSSEQEKIREIVSFDTVMLNYTFMRLLTLRPSTSEEQLDHNAYLDSFALHARNLVRFLCENSTGGNRNASDYIPDFHAPDYECLQRPLLRLEQQILDALVRQICARGLTSVTREHFTPGSCPRSSDFRNSLTLLIARASVPSGPVRNWRVELVKRIELAKLTI